jgi:hypothetical protein
MADTAKILSPEGWSHVLDALHYAAEEVGYDLHDTRNSDFYSPEDRELRHQMVETWERIADLIVPLTKEQEDKR